MTPRASGGGQESITLTVPMPASVTNVKARASRHWRAAYAQKLAYWQALDAMLVLGTVEPPPLHPLARAHIRSVMYLGGAMDDDNALARHKPLLDWLKTRGYVTDDRRKNLVWEGLPEQVIKRDGNYRIVLTLTPLPSTPAPGATK